MKTKQLKFCQVGNHEVSVLFHRRTNSRPSVCANCYRRTNTSPEKIIAHRADFEVIDGIGKSVIRSQGKMSDLKPVFSAVEREIKKISTKQIKLLKEYRIARDEYMDQNLLCEFPECDKASTDLHHGAGRIGKLLTDKRYFRALCRYHHRFVEENPNIAKQLGLSFTRTDK